MAARVLVQRGKNFKFGRDNRMCNVNSILHYRKRQVAKLKKIVASSLYGSLEIQNKDVYDMMLVFLQQKHIAHYHYTKRKENFYKINFDKRDAHLQALYNNKQVMMRT